jgi:DNA polymerase I-like protein with 3'-5' exonuclease and polymerase domains
VDGFAILDEAEILLAHNGIGYDYPVLENMYGWKPKVSAKWDSQVLAAFRFTDQQRWDFAQRKTDKEMGKYVGHHTLAAWGYRLGQRKTDYQGGFEEWNEDMQEYCEDDVMVVTHLWRYVFNHKFSIPAAFCEMRLAEYLYYQRRNGYPFDVAKAQELALILEQNLVPIRLELQEMLGKLAVKKNGKEVAPKKTMRRMGAQYHEGSAYQKIKIEEMNYNSNQQVLAALERKYGWTSPEETEKGNPKLDESVIDSLPFPEREPLLKWMKIKKIQSFLEGGKTAWLKLVTPEGRIHHRVKQSGTITHRASHTSPNLGQVPSVDSPYGAECRALFTVPKGWWQVGIDVSGLENVMLAHYSFPYDKGEFASYVQAGDTHTAGMLKGGFTEDRSTFKTWWYAWLYGAGDKKLGKILGGDEKLGRRSRAKFTAGMKGLGKLVDVVTAKADRQGWITALDGRLVPCRSAHAALNTLLQSSGSVLVKHWIVALYHQLLELYGEPSWNGDWTPLVWVHDEVQIACRTKEIAENIGRIAVDLIAFVGEQLALHCPITGEAKIGKNWAECH